MSTAAVEDLKIYSARWGADPHLVQGAGGNTSVKVGDNLVIKASGKRLEDAERDEIFTTLPLAAAAAMAAGAPAPATSNGLRPSIETSLHAVTPHKVVAHLHLVNAIVAGVRQDAERTLSAALEGLAWTFAPYAKPGPALALAVQTALERASSDVVVLGNHGVLIGGDTFEAVDNLISQVRARLANDARTGAGDTAQLKALAERLGLEVARYPDAHLSAVDVESLRFATAGTLYPDHVVFLGRGATRLSPATVAAPESESHLYLVPGLGALTTPGLPDTAHEMAACLGLVSSRIPSGTHVSPLSRADEDELINWEAEAYRRTLAT